MSYSRICLPLALILALVGCSGGSGSSGGSGEPGTRTIKGRVFLDGETNHGGIAISVDGEQVAKTDADGNYAVGDFPKGVHTISVAYPGRLTVSHDIDTPAGTFSMPDVTLIPSGTSLTSLRNALPVSAGIATVWNFNDATSRLAATKGAAVLRYRDPEGTGWGPEQTKFARASAFGLPPIGDQDPNVMAIPATGEGYTVFHNSLPNGVFGWDGYVSNYTLVMDVLWPTDAEIGYAALLQTDVRNANDADLFAVSSGGELDVGVGGIYRGDIAPGEWHRIAFSVQCALGAGGTGQMSVFVDGRFVRGGNTPADDSRCRWLLEPQFHLFTDNDGETAPVYVSSILYVDRLLSAPEIKALGGPNAAGADVPGNAAPSNAPANRRVINVAHRGQGAHAPENTLAALRSVFEAGVTHAEADVRFTSDGVAVLMHDATVNRTTNGLGNISAMTLDEVRQLDAGAWFHPDFAGEQVPTLAEALGVAKAHGAKLLLDVKVANKGAAIKAALDEAGVGVDAIWVAHGASTADARDAAARDFVTSMPGVGVLWMVVPASDTEFDRLKSENGVVGFDMDIEQVTDAFLTAAHGHGLEVIAYTAMDPETMRALIDLGVDGMETDYAVVLHGLMP